MKKCKECKYFKNGFCKKEVEDLPFLMVAEDNDCLFEKTQLRCKNCIYWKDVGKPEEKNIGGCTFTNGLYPTFLGSPCLLKDEVDIEKAEFNNAYKCFCNELQFSQSCIHCRIKEDIVKSFPNINNGDIVKIMDIVTKYSNEAWNQGANEAVNDMASRM